MEYLTLSHLRKTFNDAVAVQDFSLRVGEGKFVSLLGPSGCGKTTTLRMLAGFITPDQGSIVLKGETLYSAGHSVPPERRRMGMVFQNYALWPHMTIGRNVRFGLDRRRVDRREADARMHQILDVVGLGETAERYPNELSGGQQQRVALARALVTNPDILLLDEPLSNLDSKLREQLRGELRKLQARTGITFIYVTHDQTEALALSDMIVVMRNGEISQVGSPTEIYDRPANTFVADFVGAANILPCTVLSASGECKLKNVGAIFTGDPGTNEFAAGDDASIAVRPSDVKISSRSSDGGTCAPSRLPGRIVDVTFQGSSLAYRVNLCGLEIRSTADRGGAFGIGDEVDVTLPPNRCLVLR